MSADPVAPGGRTSEEVRRALAERIGSGQLRPGQRLGAERALAAELGVSRATLRQALAVLEDGGLVRRVPGRGGGTFVAKGKIERDLSRIVGVPALLRSQGVLAGTRVLSARLAPSSTASVRSAPRRCPGRSWPLPIRSASARRTSSEVRPTGTGSALIRSP